MHIGSRYPYNRNGFFLSGPPQRVAGVLAIFVGIGAVIFASKGNSGAWFLAVVAVGLGGLAIALRNAVIRKVLGIVAIVATVGTLITLFILASSRNTKAPKAKTTATRQTK